MHLRHYSPATPIALIDAGKRLPQGRGAYLWLFAPTEATVTIQMPASPEEYAAILYETLHRLDEQNLEWIAIEKLPEDAPWSAIRDRLARASR
jgi:L-threonylcarbamoyladenylate synthase